MKKIINNCTGKWKKRWRWSRGRNVRCWSCREWFLRPWTWRQAAPTTTTTLSNQSICSRGSCLPHNHNKANIDYTIKLQLYSVENDVWLCLWSRTRLLWRCPCASSHRQSSCSTTICRSLWHGRPAFVHSSFRSAQLPLICTISVEWPSVWIEEQRH